MGIPTVTRRRLIRNMMLTSASLLVAPSAHSRAQEIDKVSMFIDFGCMYCKEALKALMPLIESIDKRKLVFSINPILPAKRTQDGVEAAPVVLFFYAAKHIATNHNLAQLALILFEGIEEGASFHDFKSIQHWVWMRGFQTDNEKLEEVFYSYRVRMMHEESVGFFMSEKLDFVPSFVGERNNTTVQQWRWRSDLAKTISPLQKFLERSI